MLYASFGGEMRRQSPIAQSVIPARYTGAERLRKDEGFVAGIADSNLPGPLNEAVRQMKKFLLSRFIQWVCPRPPLPGCFMFQPPLFCAGRET